MYPLQFLVSELLLIDGHQLKSHYRTLAIVRILAQFLVGERIGTRLVEHPLHRPQYPFLQVVNTVFSVLPILLCRYAQPALQFRNTKAKRPFLSAHNHIELQSRRCRQCQRLVQLKTLEAKREVRQHIPDTVIHLHRNHPRPIHIRRIVDESAHRIAVLVLVLKRPAAQCIQSLLDVVVLHLRVEEHIRGRHGDGHVKQPQVNLVQMVFQLDTLQMIRGILHDTQHHALLQNRHFLLPRPGIDKRGHDVLVLRRDDRQFLSAHASSSMPNTALALPRLAFFTLISPFFCS